MSRYRQDLGAPFLPVKSVTNVRDLGGLQSRDGRVLRPGVLLRGAMLSGLSGKDARFLAERCHVKAVLDLRTPREQLEKPDRNIPGAKYYALPVFDEATSGISYEKSQKLRDKVKAIPNMEELYRSMVTRPDYVENLKVIMHTILREVLAIRESGEPGAVYYHCTAGKDRTGVVSLLLLSLCDVPYDTVLEDYLLTNRIHVFRDDVRVFAVSTLLRDPAVTDGLRRVFRAEPSYLSAAVAAIEATYGSIDAFLSGPLGIDAQTKHTFQEAVLE